ncbi:SDR family NAD(P)-dependent oxidoreductase [Candidatus Poriferisocius sp.]|uniref:SDR family NAD(P)-dependent oxidoreductase n=1 Tax=Candidatus Poriferisocius sp. TaxID=3101276 RepID=UPI003B01E2E6
MAAEAGWHHLEQYAQAMLEGLVVILTGASKGIGRGIAEYLVDEGVKLTVTSRKPERIEATAAELRERGGDVLAVDGSVGDRNHTNEVIDRTVERWGTVDGLVANAQSFRPTMPLLDVDESDMDLLLNTGPKGTLWFMQAVHPHMAAKGRGRIITFGTNVGITGGPGYGPYGASKEAIRSLTRTAAREWGRDGITVNCVNPASVAHRAPPEDDPDRLASYKALFDNHPMGRDGDPVTDIAPVIGFLLSDASQYVTGETFQVDGGGLMRP